MDEYGTYEPEDAEVLAYELKECGTIVFPYSADKVTAFIILISMDFIKYGIMPFGGNPDGRYYVGIYGKGCHHLSLKEHGNYIAEKLNICDESGEHLQRLFNGMREYLYE